MRFVVLLLALTLAGCGGIGNFGERLGLGGETATVPNVARDRSVSPARAIALINAHRADRGRAPLTVDPVLNRIAADTARELARRDTMRTEMHTNRGLARRLDGADYAFDRAAENLGAGYPTLATAVEGWKGSRKHNRNLLIRDITRAGIGLALTDKGEFKSYWVLILARPAGAGS